MLDVNDFISKLGLKPDELSDWEKDSVRQLEQMANVRSLTPDDLLKYIKWMIRSVEEELIKTNNKTKTIYLKARLQNLILLEKTIQGPEEYKKQLNEFLDSLAQKHIK